MGMDRVTQTVQALSDANIRTRRGFPTERMPQLSEPMTAVQVQRMTPGETVLVVTVFSPKGGPDCEDTAWIVYGLLTELGATCTMGACRYESKAGVFACAVTVVWPERVDCTIKAAGKTLQYAVEFTVQREISRVMVLDTDSGQQVEECRDKGWTICIEELLPASYLPETDTTSEFTIYIYRPGGSERYQKCQWLSVLIENVPNGIRRKRVARTWENRSLNTE